MKGRGEIITILCMSVFLICILYAMTYGGIVKAEELEKQPEEAGEKTEVDIEEELRWAEEVKKILKDIGVGFCDETEDKQEEDKEENPPGILNDFKIELLISPVSEFKNAKTI